MKENTFFRLSVVIGVVAIACKASGARSVDEQVNMLAERYRQVEDQLARSIRYTSKDESGGATTVRQEWYNGAGDQIKVSVERTDASGRELTEYIPHDLDSDFGWRGLFVLTRKEMPLPDGGTQVEESRKYFGETEEGLDHLIRELRKSARFKTGEPSDTVRVSNVVVDLSKENKSDSGGAEEFLGSESHELASALQMAGLPSRWAYRLSNPIGTRCMGMRTTSTRTARVITTCRITSLIWLKKKFLAKQGAITLGRSAVIITNNVFSGGHRTRLSLCSSGTTN